MQIKTLTRAHFTAFEQFASRDPYRNVLNGVNITKSEFQVTDGKMTCRLPLDIQEGDTLCPNSHHLESPAAMIISGEDMKVAKKNLPPNTKVGPGRIVIQRRALVTTDAKTRRQCEDVEQPYPDIDKPRPTGSPVVDIHINAAFLRKLAIFAASMGEDSVRLKVYGQHEPMSATVGDAEVVTMPMRKLDRE